MPGSIGGGGRQECRDVREAVDKRGSADKPRSTGAIRRGGDGRWRTSSLMEEEPAVSEERAGSGPWGQGVVAAAAAGNAGACSQCIPMMFELHAQVSKGNPHFALNVSQMQRKPDNAVVLVSRKSWISRDQARSIAAFSRSLNWQILIQVTCIGSTRTTGVGDGASANVVATLLMNFMSSPDRIAHQKNKLLSENSAFANVSIYEKRGEDERAGGLDLGSGTDTSGQADHPVCRFSGVGVCLDD
ncbi:hypothetical protein BDP27DRAFT_1376098 [Rhodocollybia butyracea]|uniref:Uncharacterized protein n=1 Tax=Rhodocollybia butyracea TaxID=206335 RepID=A0A9P5P683_9AGAR|nr:hypothetical protein BDP27DRAFT_1376098 [Rhodocollybia butyracea]